MILAILAILATVGVLAVLKRVVLRLCEEAHLNAFGGYLQESKHKERRREREKGERNSKNEQIRGRQIVQTERAGKSGE